MECLQKLEKFEKLEIIKKKSVVPVPVPRGAFRGRAPQITACFPPSKKCVHKRSSMKEQQQTLFYNSARQIE